jgi:hypothetical protein
MAHRYKSVNIMYVYIIQNSPSSYTWLKAALSLKTHQKVRRSSVLDSQTFNNTTQVIATPFSVLSFKIYWPRITDFILFHCRTTGTCTAAIPRIPQSSDISIPIHIPIHISIEATPEKQFR